jgi:phosphoenolpyruvate carboxylase
MDLKNYINEEVKKLHTRVMLEAELEEVNKQLSALNEEESAEGKTYESNVYESYKKDLEEVVKNLAEACNKLETATLRQESHIRTLPQVEGRVNEGARQKQVILDIFKEVKKAKLAAERKLYEMR